MAQALGAPFKLGCRVSSSAPILILALRMWLRPRKSGGYFAGPKPAAPPAGPYFLRAASVQPLAASAARGCLAPAPNVRGLPYGLIGPSLSLGFRV